MKKAIIGSLARFAFALSLALGPYAYLELANKYNWNPYARGIIKAKQEMQQEDKEGNHEIPKIPARYMPKYLYADTTNLGRIEKTLLR